MQIELKAIGTPELVSELIARNGVEDQVVITSFQPSLLAEIKELNPKLPVGLLFWTDETMADIWHLAENIPLDFLSPYADIIT